MTIRLNCMIFKIVSLQQQMVSSVEAFLGIAKGIITRFGPTPGQTDWSFQWQRREGGKNN